MIFSRPGVDEPLTQGDVLLGCPIYRHHDDEPPDRERVTGVVLTQACDLSQNKAKFVVVAAVYPAEDAVGSGELKAQTVRDQVRNHKVYGLYFLPEAPPPIVLPESIVDLRDLHTLPRGVVDALVAAGNRVCRLATPYREHLAQHFAVTYMRVALPDPYETRP